MFILSRYDIAFEFERFSLFSIDIVLAFTTSMCWIERILNRFFFFDIIALTFGNKIIRKTLKLQNRSVFDTYLCVHSSRFFFSSAVLF